MKDIMKIVILLGYSSVFFFFSNGTILVMNALRLSQMIIVYQTQIYYMLRRKHKSAVTCFVFESGVTGCNRSCESVGGNAPDDDGDLFILNR